MDEPTHSDHTDLPPTDEVALPTTDDASSTDHADDQHVADAGSIHAADTEPQVTEPQDTESKDTEPQEEARSTSEPASSTLSTDPHDDPSYDGQAGDSTTEADENEPQDSSELDCTTDTDTNYDAASSLLESCDLSRTHSVRTEALIQAAARAVLSMRDGHEQKAEDADDDSILDPTASGDEDVDEAVQADQDDTVTSRPASSASHILPSPAQSSAGGSAEGSHNGADDDVFSDRSPRSSVHSSNENYDDEMMEQTTEKGQASPYARSRVTSGVSATDASVVSDLSRLSRYDEEDFVPTSRSNRPAFRSPSSVRALQMSSPTPSIITSPTRSAKRQNGFPTISRLGSPSVSGQYSPRGRTTPSRFKKQEAPLVLLHVTLLPLRWSYGDMMNHFEAKKLAPLAFSSEGIKSLRAAWRQLQDRLGDTVLERGILLPHPHSDYEVLEERMLESLELPVRRRARILECGHYLGPSNQMTITDDMDNEFDSDAEGSVTDLKTDKRHWCKTCRGDIKYEELGTERVFRIKVYASNGLMSAGAWDACWKEMERVDIEVEPIIDASVQTDLAKLSAAFDHEHQQLLEAEQKQQEEEEQRYQLEAEQRLSLEEERQQLEAQRQQFEEERQKSLEESQKQLEEERRRLEEEQRQRLEEERRQQFEEERQLLDAQRHQFEEQREELEQQRKSVEEEQRQHLEEARRQELELEQKLIEEQRQELEAARQQFEEERRQRLEEEEELRRLQREEDEQKQRAASRSTSRSSYVEEEPPSPATERPTSPELPPRRRDSERLREIYGAHGRASSDGIPNNSSPSIHIHVDSARQREEEQNSRQLAVSALQDSMMISDVEQESLHPDCYSSPPPAPSPSQRAYRAQETPRRSLDSASLPELLGESIRVLLQDPKNVAIAVLVVFVAIMTGQFATRQERGIELYKPQTPQYQHHQLDSREPAAQVIMNTPAKVETVYHTVTAEMAPQRVPVSKEVEIVYQTVTQYPSQETAARVVETIYSTVTAQANEAPSQAAAPEVASEFTPPSADPSFVLGFDMAENEISDPTAMPSLILLGLDPFVCPSSATPEPESDEQIFKTTTVNDGSSDDVQDVENSPPHGISTTDQDPTIVLVSSNDNNFEDHAASTISSDLSCAASNTYVLTGSMERGKATVENIDKAAAFQAGVKTAEDCKSSAQICTRPLLFDPVMSLECSAIGQSLDRTRHGNLQEE
ncbi:unnamed protein product [Discula destructiva]